MVSAGQVVWAGLLAARRAVGFLAKRQQWVRAAAPAATNGSFFRVGGGLRVCHRGSRVEYYSRAPEYISIPMHESRAPPRDLSPEDSLATARPCRPAARAS